MKGASYNLHLSFSCNLSLTTIQFFREIHTIKSGTHWIVRSEIAKNRGTANGKVYLILYTVAEVNLQQWHGQDGRLPSLLIVDGQLRHPLDRGQCSAFTWFLRLSDQGVEKSHQLQSFSRILEKGENFWEMFVVEKSWGAKVNIDGQLCSSSPAPTLSVSNCHLSQKSSTPPSWEDQYRNADPWKFRFCQFSAKQWR